MRTRHEQSFNPARSAGTHIPTYASQAYHLGNLLGIISVGSVNGVNSVISVISVISVNSVISVYDNTQTSSLESVVIPGVGRLDPSSTLYIGILELPTCPAILQDRQGEILSIKG